MTAAWALGCISVAGDHPRDGDNARVCLCEIECVRFSPAAVASTRLSVKKKCLWVDRLFVEHSVPI